MKKLLISLLGKIVVIQKRVHSVVFREIIKVMVDSGITVAVIQLIDADFKIKITANEPIEVQLVKEHFKVTVSID